ncbi:MAG: fasciclin domain-containing protein [Nocardioides sp.]
MKRTTLNRSAGLAALALTMSLSLSACGSDEADTTAATDTTSETSAPAEETPAEESSAPAEDASAQTFGAGCAAVPADGDGSFNGMATEPVATAASANPLLSTLVAAVGAADLGDTLNSADGITVFAPVNDAFAAFPKKDLKGLLKDKETLTAVLTHHVVAGQLTPEDLAGEHETLNGDMLTVEGSGEDFTVDGNAAVICGNVPTANATVYIIDSVLMPT